MNRDNLTLKQKWQIKRHDRLFKQGVSKGDIIPYPDAIFENLRPYNFGGIPASILLFIPDLCNGNCNDMSLLMTLAFKDCQLISADTDYLRITAGKEHAGHSYVETKDFGKDTWVADTSTGLLFKKKAYDKLEKPKVKGIRSKKECMESILTQETLASDFGENRYALPMILPNIESIVANAKNTVTVIYRDKLQHEIAEFKKAINYDQIIKEIKADMRMSPKDQEKKFKTKRDNFTSNIKDEETETRRLASLYLKQVEQNPTTDFYRMPK